MMASSHPALDSIDQFIRVGGEMAKVPILANPQYRSAAEDLYQIARQLLNANENMARWLNHFLLFDFRDTNARAHFFDLVKEYRAKKAGGGFRDMKFSCGDIYFIYQRNIAGKIVDIFPQDRQAGEEAERAFTALGHSDVDMVAFIWDTVVTGIDDFIRNAEHCVDRSDLNGAEALRLAFKVTSAQLSERLERFESGLSDLVLQYARLADRPVTLT
jgi:hypothetical protein